MNSVTDMNDIIHIISEPSSILSEMRKSIDDGTDFNQLVKLGFHFAMKERASLSELLSDFGEDVLFNDSEKSIVSDLVRRMASVQLINIGNKKYNKYVCVLPITVRSLFGSHDESTIIPNLLKVNLESRLKTAYERNGVYGEVSLIGTLFPFEKYQPGILDYVNYEDYLANLCEEESHIELGKNELFLMPFTLTIEIENGQQLFPSGSSASDALIGEFSKDFLPEVRQIVNFIFKSSKYNVSLGIPMLSNEGLWGSLSFIRMENCLFDIAKQAIIASPKDYRVIVVKDIKQDFVRINFYIGNENFYCFDYGLLINFNHLEEERDTLIIESFLSSYGFGCAVVEGEIEGTLDDAVNRGLLKVCCM